MTPKLLLGKKKVPLVHHEKTAARLPGNKLGANTHEKKLPRCAWGKKRCAKRHVPAKRGKLWIIWGAKQEKHDEKNDCAVSGLGEYCARSITKKKKRSRSGQVKRGEKHT